MAESEDGVVVPGLELRDRRLAGQEGLTQTVRDRAPPNRRDPSEDAIGLREDVGIDLAADPAVGEGQDENGPSEPL